MPPNTIEPSSAPRLARVATSGYPSRLNMPECVCGAPPLGSTVAREPLPLRARESRNGVSAIPSGVPPSSSGSGRSAAPSSTISKVDRKSLARVIAMAATGRVPTARIGSIDVLKSEPFGPEVSAFLFDVGGTLYRSPDFDALVEDQAYVALADDRGCDLEEAKRLLKDRQAVNSEQLGDPTKVRALEDLGVRREVFQDAVAALDPAPYLSEAPSIGEFLGTLKQLGYKVGVLSNFK